MAKRWLLWAFMDLVRLRVAHRRAFQMSVELITEASLKQLLYAFPIVAHLVTKV